MKQAVFFDRDGVLNEVIMREGKPYAPVVLDELIINPQAYQALKQLKSLGFLLIGATNQPDFSRGRARREDIDAINQKLLHELPLDDMRVCFHDDHDECLCRKPKPGLMVQAAQDFSVDLTRSFMIGDRWKDIVAGKAASCQSIWLKNNYEEKYPETMDYVAESLLDAAEWISALVKN